MARVRAERTGAAPASGLVPRLSPTNASLDVVLVAIGLAYGVDNGSDGALLYGSPKAIGQVLLSSLRAGEVITNTLTTAMASLVAPVDEAESAHVRHRPPPSRAPSTDSYRRSCANSWAIAEGSRYPSTTHGNVLP